MQRTPCGIVVLDVRMPEMAGVDTLRALDVALPCVLMVTGDAVEAQRPRGLTADADDFLAKPATQTALEAVLALATVEVRA